LETVQQVECCSIEDKTEPKHCSLDESEKEEVTNDTTSADEEYAILEAAEEAYS